ncbi:MAG: histidine kinase [Dehalococcoidia bacterium]|nr:histidine kinase [Dehalococcoidia bacterium]
MVSITESAKDIEERLQDLQRRWPAHSVPPSMFEQLEKLEEELEEARLYEIYERLASFGCA